MFQFTDSQWKPGINCDHVGRELDLLCWRDSFSFDLSKREQSSTYLSISIFCAKPQSRIL